MLLQVTVLAQPPFFCARKKHRVHSVLLRPRLTVLSMSLLHRPILCNLEHWGAVDPRVDLSRPAKLALNKTRIGSWLLQT